MDDTNLFLLSIIIPTRNRAQLVSDLLDSLAVQVSVPFKWEVIVIDNGSTDKTAQTVKEKMPLLPFDIRYIYEPRPGLHNGRHRGSLEARGKYLAYLDDDVLLSPTWVHGIDKLLSGQAEAVVGRILPKWEDKPPRWLITLTRKPGYLSLLNMGPEGSYVDPEYVYGDNFFIPAELVFQLKGFHPDGMSADQLRYRGDGESALMSMFKEAGLRAWYDPAATAYHRIPKERMSIDYLCKRMYAQGISDSFRDIRSWDHGRDNLTEPEIRQPKFVHKTFKYYFYRIREMSLAQLLSSVKTHILELIPFTQPNIKKRFHQAYLAGYRYHQEEAQKDPDLLRWILKEDYWD